MKYWIYILGLVALVASCTKVPVGFLHISDANYIPNKIYAYHSVEDDSPWAKGAPFTSTQIQGLAGTQPIYFEFHSVKATNGGDASKFTALAKSGGLLVRGGYIQLFPDAAKSLPYGTYTVSVKVSNEGHSAILSDILTFVVKEAYEASDDPDAEDE